MKLLARLSVVWRASLWPARWSFAAAVGVVAALSVPLMAAGTPSAAHTSHLTVSQPFAAQPTVSEGTTNAQGKRLLAGDDRYSTAVLLAEVPLDAGDAATREVLVVSGESLVDAVSAVSVAASRDAAIVLTATDAVPQVVAEFITNRGFDRVTVGGGTAAVSDTTADQLAAMTTSAATAERIEGVTRVETAVAAARAAGQPGDWCDTGYRGAVVVSGESLVDGVIAAPVAYAWRLPLLFTEADRLPEVVAEFLKGTANVRHVTVVGAPTDVSDAVVRDVARSNDINVLRIDADSPAERSVELAEAVAHCRTQPVAPGQYALLDANQPVDGVAAAAALANGLGEHGTAETLIPILAVNQNSLPQPVADYLAQVGRRHDTITLYPLGGVARMTPRVIDRAVEAARGNPDTSDAAGVAAGVYVSDAALIAAGLTPGKSDGTGVAVGVGVVIEDGVMRIEPPAGRTLSEVYNHAADRPLDDDALPVKDEWLARPGVVDPYLWQPEMPVLEANVDHDGDGELSADERYPLGSPERAAYMIASGGDAPPGATVLVVPDMASTGWAGEERRDTSVRYPAGIPIPPGAPDRLTTTFEERDALRAERFEAYSGGTSWGDWERNHYRRICSATPEGSPLSLGQPGVPASTSGITCETAADWYLWMCDTRNLPDIDALSPVEAWLATFDRFYEQWTSQMPATWMFQEGLEEARLTASWRLELDDGQPLCTSNDDPANAGAPENIASHEARMAEITAWTAAPGTIITHSHGPDGFTGGGGRMLALRDVSESMWLRSSNRECYADIRWCKDTGVNILWGLRSLE